MNNDDATHTGSSDTHSDATWHQALVLLDDLLGLPIGQRSAVLTGHDVPEQVRILVQRLLAAHARDIGPLEKMPLIGPPSAHVPDALKNRRFGRWQLQQEIGYGGMSAVYRAVSVEAPLGQEAAVKVLTLGALVGGGGERFLREQQLLSRLRHPYIAPLYDAGVVEDGTPWLAMALVDGERIDHWCDRRKLTVEQRIDLALQVAEALAYAHRSLVVHRDIKPSNVLVDNDGHVRLLDFGIARLADELDPEQTATALRALTPEYAAPEQFSGAAPSTAMDVYGMGALLYRILTGQSPRPQGKQGAVTQTLPPSRAVKQDDLLPDTTRRQLVGRLRGDLDTIVMKALAHEPERRYASIEALAEDLKRWRERRPIEANAPSAWYRTRKFVQRHRNAVAFTAAFLLAIFAALGAALWQAKVATAEAVRANTMRSFMFTAFAETKPGKPRLGPASITEIVDQAIKNARADRGMNAQVRTELLTELGSVLRDQGSLESAQTILAQNYREAVRDFGESADLSLDAGIQLMHAQVLNGDQAAANKLGDRLLPLLPSQKTALRSNALLVLSDLALIQKDMPRALAEGSESVRLARTLNDPEALAQAMEKYADILLSANDAAGSAALTEELLKKRIQQFGPQHFLVARQHSNLSRIYRKLRDLPRAEAHIRAALAIDAVVLPKDHVDYANHLNALTLLLRRQRYFDRALQSETEALRINRIALPDDHLDIGLNFHNLGMTNVWMENYGAALAPLREALSMLEAKVGADNPRTNAVRMDYGFALAESGDLSGGMAEIHRAIASSRDSKSPEPDQEARGWRYIAQLQLEQKRPDEALASIDRIVALISTVDGPDSFWDGRANALRATALLDSNRPGEAKSEAAAAAMALARSKNPDAVLMVEVPLLQADASLRLEDAAAARIFAAAGASLLKELRFPPQRLTRLNERVQARIGTRKPASTYIEKRFGPVSSKRRARAESGPQMRLLSALAAGGPCHPSIDSVRQ